MLLVIEKASMGKANLPRAQKYVKLKCEIKMLMHSHLVHFSLNDFVPL